MLPIFIALLLSISIATISSAAARPQPVSVDIVYRPEYNITGPWFLRGLIAKLHPFDGSKYGKAIEYLKQRGMIKNPIISPNKVTREQLLTIHTPEYLASLQRPSAVSGIVGVQEVARMPKKAVQWYLLDPIEYATGGTIVGAQQAMQTGGVVFNMGGGYHHAKSNSGEGFCVYNDVMLAIRKLRETNPNIKVMVVDLDAHQGNGNASVLREKFGQDRNIAIFDMYNNNNIYPNRREKADMAQSIRYDNPLGNAAGIRSAPITTQVYMDALRTNLPAAVREFQPDLLIYNAGTDILAGDRLGAMQVSREAVIQRDAFVVDTARAEIPGKPIPVLVVTSGGYTAESAGIVGESAARIISKLTGQPIVQPSWLASHKGTVQLTLAAAVAAGALYARWRGITLSMPKLTLPKLALPLRAA